MLQTLTNPSILLIDDDPTVHLWAERHLGRAGFQLLSAVNGLEGLSLFAAHSPDIVLIDIEMPVMDGFTTCQKLRELPNGKNTPLLMVTGNEEVERIQAAYQAGATDYVMKPINWTVLIQRLHYMVNANAVLDKLVASELNLSKTQNIAHLGHWEWYQDKDLMYWSDQIYQIFHKNRHAYTPNWNGLLDLIDPSDRGLVAESMKKSLKTRTTNTVEYRVLPSEQRSRYLKQQNEPLLNQQGEIVGLSGTIQDISELKERENEVRRLAYYDEITQLPNRACFLELLSKALELSERHQRCFAILFLDLDGFKSINDSFGHPMGDLLLKEIAQRLKDSLRRSDIASRYINHLDCHADIARLGGDEFIVLLNELVRPEDAAIASHHIQECLAKPIIINKQTFYTSASIGIAVYPQDGMDAETLLKNADLAMYYAKKLGKGNFQYFHDSMNLKAKKRQAMETAMHQAVANDELFLYYQPVIDTETGKLVGVEALMRWHSRELGFLQPNEFIPLAEENGMIIEFGTWALHEVCRQHLRWQQQWGHLHIALNLSGVQLYQSSFINTVATVIAGYKLDPSFLVFELTESVMMDDTKKMLSLLSTLKQMGIRLSLDDFGTGYSSLSYLKRFSLDFLKIDRSFVTDLANDEEDRVIIQTILALAKALNLRTVAEGVETLEQKQFLESQGCDSFQGYLFGKPMPIDEFQSWLSQLIC